MKTVRRAANTQYRPKAGVRAATAAALSAAEDNLPRETYLSRVTRVLGAHQWKGLSLGATAEDVPFASGRPLARPATGALPSGEQYGASLERFAAGALQLLQLTCAPVVHALTCKAEQAQANGDFTALEWCARHLAVQHCRDRQTV